MCEYKLISLRDFQRILRHIRGSKIVSFIAITKPRLKAPAHKDIFKVSHINGIINFSYERAVNNRRLKAGKPADFIAGERQWGNKLSAFPGVSHVIIDGDHRLYLTVKVQRVVSYAYMLNGRQLPTDVVEEFLAERKPEEITVRDYRITNIVCFEMDRQGYIIRQ